MYGSRLPQKVTGSVVTRWHSDEFSHGAYSHVSPGGSFSDYRTLARPLGDQIFFAGEATHPTYPGTVHGAYLSGERAAREIMKLAGSDSGTTESVESDR